MNWMENDELFKGELKEGYDYQMLVAIEFLMRNFPVYVPALSIRKTVDDRDQYVNDVDIWVQVGDSWEGIEVKSRRLAFAGPWDFPFQTAMVDTKGGWEAKSKEPIAIVMISKQTKGMAVVPASTKPDWIAKECYDKTRKIDVLNYEVDKELMVTFDAFCESLRKKE